MMEKKADSYVDDLDRADHAQEIAEKEALKQRQIEIQKKEAAAKNPTPATPAAPVPEEKKPEQIKKLS